MPTKTTKPWEYYSEKINWPLVAEAIIASDAHLISQAQLRKVKKIVYNTAEYFVPYDMDCFEFVSTENSYEVTWHETQRKSDKQVIDLEAIIRPEAGKPYDKFVGEKIIFDWKTTVQSLDQVWKQRLDDSWQWKRYSAHRGAKLFEYRGLHWDGDIALRIITVPPNVREMVVDHMMGLINIKNSLVDSGIEVYPLNRPRACNSYGEKCEYYEDCENFTMPRACLLDRSYSYSSDDKFLLCPERYRRDNLKPKDPNDITSEAAFMGTLVHRGLEEVYTQLIQLQKE